MQIPYHILVVDDDPMMAKTLADILRLKGYQVKSVHSALLALELLEHDVSLSLDCVISDVKMPEMTGVELFHRIHARFPEMPVILMTAYTEEKLLHTARQKGVTEVLTKPLNIPRLLELLRQAQKQAGNTL